MEEVFIVIFNLVLKIVGLGTYTIACMNSFVYKPPIQTIELLLFIILINLHDYIN